MAMLSEGRNLWRPLYYGDIRVTNVERQTQSGFTCGEVRGGNATAHHVVELPGLRGVVFSRPCMAASGGDIHYLSVCGSGLMARVCLADVAGHGDTVAAVGRELHAHLRESVDVVDERKVFAQLNSRLERGGPWSMTTAVLATYYPPRRRLTVTYAGHPAGWLYRAALRKWEVLLLPIPPPTHRPAFIDLPLGVRLPTTYSRHRFTVSPGDRVLLITDGVLETTSKDDAPFDRHGVEALLDAGVGESCDRLADRLVAGLHEYAETAHLAHDDVSFFLGEFEDGPAGPAIWHVLKNRLLSHR